VNYLLSKPDSISTLVDISIDRTAVTFAAKVLLIFHIVLGSTSSSAALMVPMLAMVEARSVNDRQQHFVDGVFHVRRL